MPLNVTDKDKAIEYLVLQKAIPQYDKFKYIDWRHNTDDTEVFDFDGAYLGCHRIRADVKALYCEMDKYKGNIMSIEKYEDFVANAHLLDYYLIYYYPLNKVCRIIDLSKAEFAIRDITIFHKREKVNKECTVAFVNSADKIQLTNFFITEEEINAETDRENRQDQPTSEPEIERPVFDEEYIEM